MRWQLVPMGVVVAVMAGCGGSSSSTTTSADQSSTGTTGSSQPNTRSVPGRDLPIPPTRRTVSRAEATANCLRQLRYRVAVTGDRRVLLKTLEGRVVATVQVYGSDRAARQAAQPKQVRRGRMVADVAKADTTQRFAVVNCLPTS